MQVKKKNTILVPIDFSEIANHALNHAAEVAKQFRNNLALLHVVEEGLLTNVFSFGKNDHMEDLAREAAKARLEKYAAEIKAKHGLDCITSVTFGKIYKMILEAVDDLHCDSIIMGSNGSSGIDQIIGSNASRVIGQSNVPVIVVKSEQHVNSYRNIVFPLDLTAESKQKVNWAIHIGKVYGSTIHIFTAKTGTKDLDARLLANLKQIEKLLEKSKIKFTEKILPKSNDNFANDTIKFSEKINADMIMIMTQQEDKKFSEYIIGSYAQQVVNRSLHAPVMCINPKRIDVDLVI
ncbi:MAG: universal stress protein [Bacteroidia bacterium]